MGLTLPSPPFVRLFFRHDKQLGRFVPCEDADKRGTLVLTVDSLGRRVIPVFGGYITDLRIVGYKLGAVNSTDEEMDEVQKWLATHDYRRPRDAIFAAD